MSPAHVKLGRGPDYEQIIQPTEVQIPFINFVHTADHFMDRMYKLAGKRDGLVPVVRGADHVRTAGWMGTCLYVSRTGSKEKSQGFFH